MYQVHIVKKAPKWNCKVCNAKQSVNQVYFQGSGRDCRLQVQQLNAMKANDVFLTPSGQNNVGGASDTFANVSQESDSDSADETEWTKCLESSEIKGFEDVEDLVFDNAANDVISSKKISYNINKNSISFEQCLDNTDSESEDVNNETERLHSTNFNCNSSIDGKCDTQDNTNCNNVANIFETYNELDDPIDF